MRIAVLDDWQNVARGAADWSALERRVDGIAFFREPISGEDDLVRALADFEIVLTLRERTAFPASLIARLPRLRMLGVTGPRVSTIDVPALVARGVVVCNTRSDDLGESPAELALALMLGSARHLAQGDANVRIGRFQADMPLGQRLSGKVLGLIGLGKTGILMARYGRALGMRVLAWSENLTDERAIAEGAERVSKAELLSSSDVVSLHLVLSERTRSILRADDLAAMKPGAILVNTSRGPLVEEAALIQAVQSGRIFAALDVFDREPLDPAHPLITAPNTLLTPHLGYAVRHIFERFFQDQIENVQAFLDGSPIRRMGI